MPTLNEWHSGRQTPTGAVPDALLLLQLESGYLCTGEYEAPHWFAWCERYAGDGPPVSACEVDDGLDWVLEEIDPPRAWCWIKRPA